MVLLGEQFVLQRELIDALANKILVKKQLTIPHFQRELKHSTVNRQPSAEITQCKPPKWIFQQGKFQILKPANFRSLCFLGGFLLIFLNRNQTSLLCIRELMSNRVEISSQEWTIYE